MFLDPRHIKEGKHYRHALKRMIHYKEDVLPPAELQVLRDLVAKMTAAIKSRRREDISRVQVEIEEAVGKVNPPAKDSGLRENVEVFLVAIIVAAGVRAYFLQPFKIPTGSMQPTLFGIIAESSATPPPNPLIRVFEFVWLGRNYIDVVAKEDDTVVEVRERTFLNFFTFSTIVGTRSSYTVFAPKDALRALGVQELATSFKKGDIIARGHIDTGDQVFVDKMTYNFLPPRMGDVFVFKTTGIRRILMPRGTQSQHYIKRLAGVPGMELSISDPKLFLNGRLAEQSAFQRVMSCENGYRGYSNPTPAMGGQFLTEPGDTFLVPSHAYFALGDNSRASSDSRFWGIVPEQNVAGKGLFVYWPFSKRWGLIR